MSHSTVLVVIRDAANAEEAEDKLESLLEPFNENTQVDPYPVAVDADEVARAVNFYKENPQFCDGNQGPGTPYPTTDDIKALHTWTKQAVGQYFASDPDDAVYDDDKGFSYLSTYNPRSRWDWWTLGGRWHGFFQLKPEVTAGSRSHPLPSIGESVRGEKNVPAFDGTQDAILGPGGAFGDSDSENFEGRVDLARKGAIDFEAMRDLAGANADLGYDAYEKAAAGIEPAPLWKDFVNQRFRDAGIDPDDLENAVADDRKKVLDQARTDYHAHPWVSALREAGLNSWFDDLREMYCLDTGGRETYVARARDNCTTTFAVLMDGEWHEQGKMGWFGMARDEMDHDAWAREHAKLLDSLPDDTYLAVVDVHI